MPGVYIVSGCDGEAGVASNVVEPEDLAAFKRGVEL
jgi:hypothetical protein